MVFDRACWVALTASVVALVGCESGEDRLKEDARVRSGIESSEAVEAENANLQRRIDDLSAELERRQAFYQETKGVYEGPVMTARGEFRIRVTLVPSIPVYARDRVRSLSEVESDLTNLSYNVQFLQWNPANPLSVVGCRIQGVRPDLERREMEVASSDCANVYFVRFRDQGLEGEVQPSTTPDVFTFEAARIERKKP